MVYNLQACCYAQSRSYPKRPYTNISLPWYTTLCLEVLREDSLNTKEYKPWAQQCILKDADYSKNWLCKTRVNPHLENRNFLSLKCNFICVFCNQNIIQNYVEGELISYRQKLALALSVSDIELIGHSNRSCQLIVCCIILKQYNQIIMLQLS